MLTTSFARWAGDFSGIFIYNLAKELVKNGIEVSVVMPYELGAKKRECMDGIEVHRFQYMIPARFQALATNAGLLSDLRSGLLTKFELPFFLVCFLRTAVQVSRQCDVIHTHWIPAGMIGVLLGRVLHKPVVLSVHRVVFPQWAIRRVGCYVLKGRGSCLL